MSAYFSANAIIQAINALSAYNPFFGITFLACKRHDLPVGTAIDFSMDQKTRDFLFEHHRLCPESAYLFQPFKSTSLKKQWIVNDYPAKSLQAINTQTFGEAFLHETGTSMWGWDEKYICFLARRLPKNQKIPALYLAVWIYKNTPFSSALSMKELIEKFFNDYKINSSEIDSLFNAKTTLFSEDMFTGHPVLWKELIYRLSPPPDSRPESGGILENIIISNLGPSRKLEFQPNNRLNIITGDNCLGKTFLLEASWLLLTGNSVITPLMPCVNQRDNVSIEGTIRSFSDALLKRKKHFDPLKKNWECKKTNQEVHSLILYVRVDGSYGLWDPYRTRMTGNEHPLILEYDEIWNGRSGVIEGILRDWISWKNQVVVSDGDDDRFGVFHRVLQKLLPPDYGDMQYGKPIRLPGNILEIPTLNYLGFDEPIIHTSAGLKRIITIAYVMTWLWYEHTIAAEQLNENPQRRMIVMIDELEAHMHPKWQRAIIPALVEATGMLNQSLDIQYIITTHSPLVMASLDSIFNQNIDEIFHFYNSSISQKIILESIPYIRYGDVCAWLTSPLFELKHARSSEAEQIIEEAKRLQLLDVPEKSDIININEKLKSLLSANDDFWPRWVFFAKKHGAKF